MPYVRERFCHGVVSMQDFRIMLRVPSRVEPHGIGSETSRSERVYPIELMSAARLEHLDRVR